MKRSTTIALAAALSAALGAFAACGDDDAGSSGSGTGGTSARPGEGGEGGEQTADDPAARRAARRHRAALAKTRVHLDLQALAHLADVDQRGLYLDFGTPARMKYTMGRWHSGWGTDQSTDNRDFSRMSTTARAWFHLDAAGALTLRFRGRAVGSQSVVVYLNGERIGQVDFAGTGVAEHDLAAPATATRVGENALLFRAAEAREVDGDQVAAELDSIHVFRGDAPSGEIQPPRYAELVRELRVGSDARRALVVRSPGTLRWYAEIPGSGRLAFAVGAAGEGPAPTAVVTVTPEGGQAAELFRAELGARWSEQLLDLSRFRGEVVRIELASEGEGEREVGWAEPAVVVPLPGAALADAEARSVIVLTIDTLRASKLRAYNPRSRVRTPVLDQFAEQAAVFERAQSPENWTKPAVASILTSLTPATHNTKEQGSSLPDSALTLGEVYQGAGFTTATFLANGYVSDRFGFNQGWNHYTNYIRDERPTEAGHVFREAGDWIEQHHGERFFVYIQTIDPHVPYDPPEEFLRMYDAQPYDGRVSPRSTGNQLEEAKRDPENYFTARDRQRLEALHDGEISYHDQEMGRFIERLRGMGVYDQSVFVVTSDHGEEFFEHGSFGHGHSVYQELLHVPLMVRWPGVIAPRRVSPTVSTLDIGPTILEATGVAIPDVFEGTSLLGTARGVPRPGPAVAFSDKLDDRRVVVGAGYKLVTRGSLTWTMFNLRNDPGEQAPIETGRRHPIALRYLRIMLGQFLGAVDRGNWLHAGPDGASRVLPASRSQIDAEMCRQLQALGYVDARCDDLL